MFDIAVADVLGYFAGGSVYISVHSSMEAKVLEHNAFDSRKSIISSCQLMGSIRSLLVCFGRQASIKFVSIATQFVCRNSLRNIALAGVSLPLID